MKKQLVFRRFLALFITLSLFLSFLSIGVADTKSKNIPEEYKKYQQIDWKGVSRNPDKYKGETVQLKGRVLQVVEDVLTIREKNGVTKISDHNYGLRIATKGRSDDVVYVIIAYEDVEDEVRILEDDTVTVYGTYDGIMSYTTVLGSKNTLPQILGDYLVIDE